VSGNQRKIRIYELVVLTILLYIAEACDITEAGRKRLES